MIASAAKDPEPLAVQAPASILRTMGLTKVYAGTSQPALDELDLTVHQGEIFGLLGPNGAGKTTAISIMSTLLRPTAGKVVICGLDTTRDADRIRALIGVVPQHIALFDRLTVKENLTYFGKLYGLKGGPLKAAVKTGLEIAGLAERADDQVKTFSGGMQRRANLAAGILHRPKLLFLDEPTVGIDAHSRNMIFETLARLKEDGTTMVYTTHYMEEAQQLCHRIAIIDRGSLVAQGRSERLIKQHPGCCDLGELFLRLTGRQLRDG